MRTWAILFCGLLIWAVHFFTLYGIGEFGGAGAGARLAAAGITVAALAAVAGLALWIRSTPKPDDAFGCWLRRTTQGGLALSAVAVLWQTLPILFPETSGAA